MHNFLIIFITGFGILLIAILINFVANFLGLETWYIFVENIQKNGFSHIVKTGLVNFIFLFFVYPFLLGLSAYYILKIFKYDYKKI